MTHKQRLAYLWWFVNFKANSHDKRREDWQTGYDLKTEIVEVFKFMSDSDNIVSPL